MYKHELNQFESIGAQGVSRSRFLYTYILYIHVYSPSTTYNNMSKIQ